MSEWAKARQVSRRLLVKVKFGRMPSKLLAKTGKEVKKLLLEIEEKW